MALNRIVASLDDSIIAGVAEHAVQNHSGSFDASLAELICAGVEAIAATVRIADALEAAE